jgi:FAD-dependent urate hydroxylase
VARVPVAIVGAGPYGLSLAAHLAHRNVENRIFGQPMKFWSKIANAGGERYLKSFCFGTSLSTPRVGYTLPDYNTPRGLETFEPCSMENFAAYGLWFQENIVDWVESVDVVRISTHDGGYILELDNGEYVEAARVIVATGLSRYESVPSALRSLPPDRSTHTTEIARFDVYAGRQVAVLGAGQSALEAAALLYEVGAKPQLLLRDDSISWMQRVADKRSAYQRIRSPIAGLGTGPKAWALTNIPGAVHRFPEKWRTNFVKNHLPPEGAWWLRDRVENKVSTHFNVSVTESQASEDGVTLRLLNSKDGSQEDVRVDNVVAGTGFGVDVDRLEFLDPDLREGIVRLERAPRLNAVFESSVSGLHFIGPASAMSFGPLFRFVIGAEYAARVTSKHLAETS